MTEAHKLAADFSRLIGEVKACIVVGLRKAGVPEQRRLPLCRVDFRLLLIASVEGPARQVGRHKRRPFVARSRRLRNFWWRSWTAEGIADVGLGSSDRQPSIARASLDRTGTPGVARGL